MLNRQSDKTCKIPSLSGVSLLAIAMLLGINLQAQGLAPVPDKPAAKTSSPADPSKSQTKDEDFKGDHDISDATMESKVYEDFKTPSLSTSHLISTDPVVGEVDESDKVDSVEITQVLWRSADPINLFILKPTGVAKPPVILYLFDYPTDNQRYYKPDFRRFLTRNGFAAVGFVPALTGDRYHSPRPMKQWFVSELQESMSTSAHDIQMILNYLAKRGDMDMDRVGIYAEGAGASIAILAAAQDPRIKTLDLVDPWGDWPDWIAKSSVVPEKERADYLKPEFLNGVADLDPVKWLPELKNRTVRLRILNSVTETPTEARKKIEAAAPSNAELIRFDDTKAFGKSVSGGVAFDWIKQQVQSSLIRDYRAAGQTQGKESSNPAKN